MNNCLEESLISQLRTEDEKLTDELTATIRDAERYRWLRDRLLGADFDWNKSGVTILAFEFPRNIGICGNCDKNIDAAMANAT